MRILSSTWRPVALAQALEPLNNKTNRNYHSQDMDKKSKDDKWYFQERNKNVLDKMKNLLIERRVLLKLEHYILKISHNQHTSLMISLTNCLIVRVCVMVPWICNVLTIDVSLGDSSNGIVVNTFYITWWCKHINTQYLK